ncbi:hypothetical protein [Limnobacter sp.]|uniref:hypothetical protein n=1 Tax=Limnobacter sp. TaxID=2003368 RepID=UPI002FE32533
MLSLDLKGRFDSLAYSDHVQRIQALLAELDVKQTYSASPDYPVTVEKTIHGLQTQGIDNAYHQACVLFSVLMGGVRLEQMPAILPVLDRVLHCVQKAIHLGAPKGAYEHIHTVLAGTGSCRQAWLNVEPETNCLHLLSHSLVENPFVQLMCLHQGLPGQMVEHQLHREANCFRTQSGFQHKVFGEHSPQSLIAQVCRNALAEDPRVVSPTALVEHCELGMLTPTGFVATQQLELYDARQVQLDFTQRTFELNAAMQAKVESNWQSAVQPSLLDDSSIRIASPCLNADLQFCAGWQKGAAGFEFRIDAGMHVRMSANALVWEANLQHQGVLVNLGIQLQQDLAIHWSIKETIQTGQLPLGAPLLVRQHDAPLHLLVNPVLCVGKPVLNATELIAGYLGLKLHAQINPETRQLGLFLTLSHSGLMGHWQAIDPLVGWCCGVWELGAELTMAQWDLSNG